MTKTLKFVYSIILFITLFLVAKNVDALKKCITFEDCPISKTRVYKCLHGECRYTIPYIPKVPKVK
ncbi:putative Late nodulin [Medicago truncatula]|uniref:Nodule Cysteine-Rich (NCR) secreted peptide n=1 Tax=Medicago truncatula TaxID=3880 RepID=G7JXA2_MEDTR|nr:Nodule Cysteine-Rich (NCR) secreted peptide [Medicago truncatula]RHN55932.1 putative Late nodulin [Medicago truncatula]